MVGGGKWKVGGGVVSAVKVSSKRIGRVSGVVCDGLVRSGLVKMYSFLNQTKQNNIKIKKRKIYFEKLK